jgi:nucleotide-binding universal stress UspA family protein
METPTQGVVVGYDGSPDSDEALRWAAEVARRRSEPLVALIVVEPLEAPRSRGWPESWWEDIENRARATLDDAGAVDGTVERHVGALVPTLLAAAKEGSMLVLGSRGHSRVGEMLLGSTSQSAARHARGPVVVVRKPHDSDAHRILVGSDDSEPSRRAIDFACDEATATGQEVVLVRAWKPLVVPIDKNGDVPPSMTNRLLQEEESLLASLDEARKRFPHLEIDGEFIAANPGQALVDFSRTSALLVVGSRGHTVVGETVLGSVSHQVLHRAGCPVAVVH